MKTLFLTTSKVAFVALISASLYGAALEKTSVLIPDRDGFPDALAHAHAVISQFPRLGIPVSQAQIEAAANELITSAWKKYFRPAIMPSPAQLRTTPAWEGKFELLIALALKGRPSMTLQQAQREAWTVVTAGLIDPARS